MLAPQPNFTQFHYSKKDQHQTAVKAETTYDTVGKILKYIQDIIITFPYMNVLKSGSQPHLLDPFFIPDLSD